MATAAWGRARAVNERLKRGISVSPFGVRRIWLRHDLATMKLRLRALEAKMAQVGGQLILTEGLLTASEKAKTDKGAHGEFDTACPGYCGAQDTFHVGALKGVGRTYQQTFIDSVCQAMTAKLRLLPLICSTTGSSHSSRNKRCRYSVC